MKNKILIIILIILFILIIVLANILLSSKNNIETNTLNNVERTDMKSNSKILKGTNSNFEEEVLKSEKVVIVDFYADWCGPCKMLSPLIEELAKENEQIKVVKVDVDEEEELAKKYEVMSIPTIVAIKDGQEINRIVGLADKIEILNMIK